MDGRYLIFAALGLGFAGVCLYNWWQNRGPTLTGPATLVSRRVEYGKNAGGGKYGSSGWNYYLTFSLTDGDQIELSVFQQQFGQWKDGTHGTLYWHNSSLNDFVPNEEE